jgi:hypothetical protein
VSATSIATLPAAGRSRARQLAGRIGARPALAVATASLALTWAALIVTHRTVPLPVPRATAIADAESHSHVAAQLAAERSIHIVVTPLDSRQEVLWFYRGPKLIQSYGVTASGAIGFAVEYRGHPWAYGSPIANSTSMLALLAVLFALMTGVWPILRLRNLDVLVALSTTLSVVLLNAETPEAQMLATAPALLYLACRCAWRALAGPRRAAPATPIYEILTGRCELAVQVRILRLAAVALAVIVALVGYSSAGVVDVASAVLEGATSILHGLIPYGHVPVVIHGDTYPFGSYLLFVPFAALTPATSPFDFPQWALNIAVVAALAVAAGLWRFYGRARVRDTGAARREAAGLRMAIAWLTFPPMLVTVSTGTTDVVLAAILLAALMLWRRPTAATTVLAVGGWFKLYPVALLPTALARLGGSALRRSIAAIVLISAVMLGILVALGGTGAISAMVHAMSYQLTRTDPHSLWAWIGSVPLQQLVEAATIALIAGACVVLRRDPELAADRTRMAALFAAILLGLQIAAGYWAYLYLVWVIPFVLLSLLSDGANAKPARAG